MMFLRHDKLIRKRNEKMTNAELTDILDTAFLIIKESKAYDRSSIINTYVYNSIVGYLIVQREKNKPQQLNG